VIVSKENIFFCFCFCVGKFLAAILIPRMEKTIFLNIVKRNGWLAKISESCEKMGKE
jgi:hypothetical protein